MKTLITTIIVAFSAPLALYAEESTEKKHAPTNSKITFTITGEVNKPGIYEAPHWATAFEAIAISGGMQKHAYKTAITIFRLQDDGTTKAILVPLKDAFSGKIQFPAIQHRDRIYIKASKL